MILEIMGNKTLICNNATIPAAYQTRISGFMATLWNPPTSLLLLQLSAISDLCLKPLGQSSIVSGGGGKGVGGGGMRVLLGQNIDHSMRKTLKRIAEKCQTFH
jgi:hypothetical protein